MFVKFAVVLLCFNICLFVFLYFSAKAPNLPPGVVPLYGMPPAPGFPAFSVCYMNFLHFSIALTIQSSDIAYILLPCRTSHDLYWCKKNLITAKYEWGFYYNETKIKENLIKLSRCVTFQHLRKSFVGYAYSSYWGIHLLSA